MIGNIFTGICQNTISPEIEKQVIKDSITISWEKGNEIVNGLENEKRLDTAYANLKVENESLFSAYQSSEKRNVNFKDTIIPSLKNIIKVKEDDNKDLKNLNDAGEDALKEEKKKKWWWALLGTAFGVIITVVLGG